MQNADGTYALRFGCEGQPNNIHVTEGNTTGKFNGLLRQYFPKGLNLSNVHQNRLNTVARRLNERPRETLNHETPTERFSQCVASIG